MIFGAQGHFQVKNRPGYGTLLKHGLLTLWHDMTWIFIMGGYLFLNSFFPFLDTEKLRNDKYSTRHRQWKPDVKLWARESSNFVILYCSQATGICTYNLVHWIGFGKVPTLCQACWLMDCHKKRVQGRKQVPQGNNDASWLIDWRDWLIDWSIDWRDWVIGWLICWFLFITHSILRWWRWRWW